MEDPDRKREDEWFLKNERQLLETARLAREKREKERAESERAEELARLRALHFMKCPKCGHDLKQEDLDGVKIDRCGFCEGVFLDAGELDEIFLKREADRGGFLRRLVRL